MFYCIPSAGNGSRFPKDKWGAKPLIKVWNKTLLEYSLRSLPLKKDDFLLLIIRDDEASDDVALTMRSLGMPCQFEIKRLEKVSRGQSETVFWGVKDLSELLPIWIHNCDTAFNLGTVNMGSESLNRILVFESQEERWSYASIDKSNRVLRTAEKVVISKFATSGTYQFSSVALFCKYFLKSTLDGGELFVAPIYNKLIQDGIEVTATKIAAVYPLGTPDDITLFSTALRENWLPQW